MFVAKHSWPRWSGDVSEAIRAIEVAQETAESAVGVPPKTRIDISFGKRNMQHTEASTADLETLSESEIADVDALSVAVYYPTRYWRDLRKERDDLRERDSPDTAIKLAFRTGCDVEVRHDDKTWTEGTAKRLKDTLGDHGMQPSIREILLVGLMVGMIGLLIVLMAMDTANGEKDGAVQGATRIYFLISLGVIGVAGAGLAFLFPAFELTGNGHRNRWQRWGTRFYAVFGTVFLGIVSSAIYGALVQGN